MLLVCVCVCVGLQERLWFAIMLCIDLLLLFCSIVSTTYVVHGMHGLCICGTSGVSACRASDTDHLTIDASAIGGSHYIWLFPGVSWSQAMSKVSWPKFRGSTCRNSPPNFLHVWISAVYLAMCKRVQNLRSMLFHWLDLICSRTRCVQTLKLQQSREAHHWHESCWWLSSSSLARLSNTSL